MSEDRRRLDRRRFIQTAAAGVGAAAIGSSITRGADEPAPATAPQRKVDPKDLIWRSRNPAMEYRRLGRTNFMTGRIVAGLARAQLLTRWGLRQQARRCLADIQQLDDADSPRIRLALGEALAGLGAADDARACPCVFDDE